MIWVGLILIVIAGIAEHYKDLSEEGKLKGYWDKNYMPDWVTGHSLENSQFWWKVHWLQGGIWNEIPVWVRQYLSFRDGWHLLKFVSLNSFALGIVLLTNSPWWWFIIIRSCFSLPETILRKYPLIKYKK
jgi:hypothetical protein